MNYWLDLFTGTTWKEFLSAGANVTGFRALRRKLVSNIQPGDILLCYLTGVMRWVGALEVIGPSRNRTNIWGADDFPVRLDVKPLVTLPPEHGVPLDALLGKVAFFADESMRGTFKGFFRGSPRRFLHESDGSLVYKLLRAAEEKPVARPVDPRKLARKPIFTVQRREGDQEILTEVTVPEPDDDLPETGAESESSDELPAVERTRHTEIQHTLLALGADMGLDVWVARNDRSRSWRGQRLGDMPNMVQTLPTQFNDATNRTIELIDVLWLKGNSFVAAFEVECTTSIYSGLLRMADLLALQPNLNMRLFLVAPDQRRSKVEQEIRRPTFSLRERPLNELCGFIPFNLLTERIAVIRKNNLASSLHPDFLSKSVAEYFKRETPKAS